MNIWSEIVPLGITISITLYGVLIGSLTLLVAGILTLLVILIHYIYFEKKKGEER